MPSIRQNTAKHPPERHCSSGCCFGSGGWIRTTDLRVMSPTSCHCSTPRQLPAPVMPFLGRHGWPAGLVVWWARGPCLPAPGEPVPSALRCFTTRFEMGRGGATALNARHWLRGAAPRRPTAASLSVYIPSPHRPPPPQAQRAHARGRPGKPSSMRTGSLHRSPDLQGQPLIPVVSWGTYLS